MIATDQIRGPARRARLGPVTAFLARRRGLRDAPGLRPLLSVPSEPGRLLDLPDIVTPFVMETRASTLRAVGQLRSRLLRDKRKVIIGIHAESVRVVTQYDVRAEPSPAALARYGARVGSWRADAEVCRARASALTHEANQQLACYWDAVWLTVQQARSEEGRTSLGTMPTARTPYAPTPGAAYAPAPTPGTPEASMAPALGLEPPSYPPFTARPEHWLPGRVTLDDTWDDVDAWLLIGSIPARTSRDQNRTPAVARALELLDTQSHPARVEAALRRPAGSTGHHGRGTP
ncbi:hypothetical protein [Streptomyces sp. NPDC017868]|uniref:hypothetical protein n=1 Tax=Streptomyces sp. NPDC017868 TaxID=3365014 RepID=UPI0037A574FB